MDDFTLADVYEHAAKIGQDIETLIREYGEGSVEQLMPKIVFTLEQLEGLAERRQKDVATISDLNAQKERLSIECTRESAYKRQAEEKIEYLEAMLNDDTKSLQNKINVLTEENDILKTELRELDQEFLTQKTKALPGDVDLMVKMKTTIDAQRDEIRELNQENDRHRSEIEALNEQTNRLTSMNERLRVYNQKLQDRLAETIEHKVQAESSLASVKLANENGNGSLDDEIDSAVKEASGIEDNVSQEIEASNDKNQSLVAPANDADSMESSQKSSGMEEKNAQESNDKEGIEKAVKEEPVKKDPNRPRYTLAEMQQVLDERNRYKERVSILEDVLEACAPRPVRSSTLEKGDENLKKRQGLREGSKETPKRESKVRGIFGSFWKGSS